MLLSSVQRVARRAVAPRGVVAARAAVRAVSTKPSEGVFASTATSVPQHTPHHTGPTALEVAAGVVPPIKSVALREDVDGRNVTHSWNRYSEDLGPMDLKATKEAALLSDVDNEFKHHTATIYRPSAHAMMSTRPRHRQWTIRFPVSAKWGNPLMGWMSGGETRRQITPFMRFETPEQAMLMCARNGWKYTVKAPVKEVEDEIYNTYAHNFISRGTEYQLKTLGARKGRHLYANPKGRSDQWVNLRRSAFGPDAWTPSK